MRRNRKAFFGAALLVLCLLLGTGQAALAAFEPFPGTQYQGIDVSKWQGTIDFQAVADAGIQIVYMRAGQGTDYVDPYFQDNYTKARAAGLKVGFYYYVTAQTPSQARQEAAFAPYLPAAAPAGYGDFYGLLTYQEGVTNSLYLRWSRGYADVSVRVSLPEGENTVAGVLVDPDAPETYDKRLYSIPWADSVPEEHRQSVDNPVFPAEEMTRELVEARSHLKTELGEPDALVIDFAVLHPDGTVAEYRCEGLTVDQVWAMAEDTL